MTVAAPAYRVEPWSPPKAVRVKCGCACACGGRGHFCVAVTCAMVDVDERIAPAVYLARLTPADRALVLGWSTSTRGGLHLYIDAPSTDADLYAARFGGDEAFGLFSHARGWCGDRPRPLRCFSPAPPSRAAWWRELLRAHTIGASLNAAQGLSCK